MKKKFLVVVMCAGIMLHGTGIFAETENYENISDEVISGAAISAEQPSNWAVSEINEGIEKGMILPDMQSRYTEAITREDFCRLIVNTLRVQSPEVLSGATIGGIDFDDTDNADIKTASAMGIVAGVGENKFAPNAGIKRQEAARMLYMAATVSDRFPDTEKYFDNKFTENNKIMNMPYQFSDIDEFEHWASVGINYCERNSIMQGVGNNRFDPSGTYSREQAYATALRLYKCFGGENADGAALSDMAGDIPDFGEGTEIYDSMDGVYIVKMPIWGRTGGEVPERYDYAAYKADGTPIWVMPDVIRFTDDGDLLYIEENNTSLVTNKTVTVYDLLRRANLETGGTEIMYVYKK